MLDPFTSLSLASAIIQLVDFSSKLVNKSTEIYRSSALQENVELEKVAEDLKRLNANLLPKSPPSGFHAKPVSEDERALTQLAAQSKAISDELIAILQDLKVRCPHQKWQSFRQALKCVRKKNKVHALETNLKNLQENINGHLLKIMSSQQSSIVQNLSELKEQSKRHEVISTGILENIKNHITDILDTSAPFDPKLEILGRVRKFQSIRTEVLVDTKKRDCVFGNNKTQTDINRLLEKFVEEGRQIATAQQILESLRFKQLKERESNIKKSHASTYRWIFKRSTPDSSRDVAFKDWLEKGSNVYWVAGKAGSGKSTLMKLVCNDQLTFDALEVWAGHEQSIIAKHFFWSGGNQMQKSQSGLLRSLLYQILQQCPSLIKLVCPKQWQAERVVELFPTDWSDEELFETLIWISKIEYPIKICIFVDGLDEYRGEHRDIIYIFQHVGASKNIKVCVSSRPWNVFEKAFGKSTDANRIMLQDFTKNDIRDYVSDTLSNDNQFRGLAARDPQAQDLVVQIAEKANGVFLWVFLVVRSLLSGLTDDNSITDMQQRVYALPEDLEAYFKLMLSNIEPFYRAQTAHIFLISVQATQPQSVLFYSFLENVIQNPSFSLGDIEPLAFGPSQLKAICDKQRTYLNARCKDLLEVTEVPEGYSFMRYKVDFLHRTVKDFLSTGDVNDDLKRRAGAGFDARRALCHTHLAQIKASVLSFIGAPNELVDSVVEFLNDVYEIESYHDAPEIAHMDEFNRVMSEALKDSNWFRQNEWTDYIAQAQKRSLVAADDKKTVTSFLSTALEARLHKYVACKLDEDPALLFQKRALPLLYRALERSDWAQDWFDNVESYFDIEMARLLFKRGANPNERLERGKGITVWNAFLCHCASLDLQEDNSHGTHSYIDYRRYLYEIAEMFIEHGADVDLRSEAASYHMKNAPQPWLTAGELLEGALMPEDWAKLKRLMEEKRSNAVGRWSKWFRRGRAQRAT